MGVYKRYRKPFEMFWDRNRWELWSLSFDLSKAGLSFRIAAFNICFFCLRIDMNDPENVKRFKERNVIS